MSGGTRTVQVLHVDDDREFAELSRTFVEGMDDRFEVTPAEGAEEGLALLSSQEFDCVVSDYEMPEMDGIEFLRAVRERDLDLPFILLTGEGSEAVASEAISAGVTDYLTKGMGTSQYRRLCRRISDAVDQQMAREHGDEIEDRLRALSENANEILWMFTADWEELLFVNSAYEDIWGAPVEELLSDPTSFMRYVHPDDREAASEAMAQLQSGESIDIEIRVNESASFERWVWIQGEPVFEDGTVSAVAGFARDVTERKRRERELETLRERTEFVLEGTDSIIWTFDLETHETEVLYRPLNDIVGEPGRIPDVETFLERSVHPDDRQQVSEAFAAVSSGAEAEADVVFRSHPDAEESRWLRARGYRKPTDEGQLLVGLLTDVTEQYHQERQLKRQNERLEEFTSIVSHDLRNPLSVASGRLALAREECDSEHLADLEGALERMSRLIEDLRSLAREGGQVGELQPVDVETAFSRAWQHVATGEATCELSADRTVTADPGRLEQLFENLIRNSVEHGSTGSRTTSDDSVEHGSMSSRTAAGDSAEHAGDAEPLLEVTVGDIEGGFYVEDDGPGIPTARREEVLEPGVSSKDAGSGLGLDIVRRVADAHGWDVEVTESETGGARFEFRDVRGPE